MLQNAVSGNKVATRAYLAFMGPRLVEMHHILKDTRSIYLHLTRLLATTSKARWTRYLFCCSRAIYSCSICAKASRLSACAAARCNCSRRCKSSMFSSAGVSALTASAWNFTCNNAKICLMVVSLKIS